VTIAVDATEYHAVRFATARSTLEHASAFIIEGRGAFETTDSLVTADLFLSDAQMRPALVLDEEGLIRADALVGRDDDRYVVCLEGPPPAGARAQLEEAASARGASVRALTDTHEAVALTGPYAWELLGEWLGSDLVGMPYLSLFRLGEILVLRAGTTGEFGYEVFLPRGEAEPRLASLEKIGRDFDLVTVAQSTLDLAALENGFFSIRGEGARSRDPAELQLRWRVGRDKSFLGADALRARGPSTHRVTWVRCAESLCAGDAIVVGDLAIGEILHTGSTVLRPGYVGVARLARPWASAGVADFERVHAGVAAPIRTVAPPILNNRSLHVSPQRHGYRERASFTFPEV